jgi:hypothetical protein
MNRRQSSYPRARAAKEVALVGAPGARSGSSHFAVDGLAEKVEAGEPYRRCDMARPSEAG